jgi:hypothetical protein
MHIDLPQNEFGYLKKTTSIGKQNIMATFELQ